MEDLALIVSLMLGGEIIVSLVVVGFALTYRFTGKFRKTTMGLVGVLAIVAGWLFGTSWQMGLPAVVALIASILFIYIPGRSKK
jgi:ABC-type iron transport system FetAB permease component